MEIGGEYKMICKLKSAAIVAMLLLCVFASCAKSKKSGAEKETASVESTQPKQVTVWFCFSKDLPSPLPTEIYDKATLELMRRANVDGSFYNEAKISKLKEDMKLSDEEFRKLDRDREFFKPVLRADPLILNKPGEGESPVYYDLPVCFLSSSRWSCTDAYISASIDYKEEYPPHYNGCFEGWRTKDGELVTSLEITADTESDIYLRPSYREPRIGDKFFCLKRFDDTRSDYIRETKEYAGVSIEIASSSYFATDVYDAAIIVSPELYLDDILVYMNYVFIPEKYYGVAKELGRICFFMKKDESGKYKEPSSQFEDDSVGYVMPYDSIDFDGYAVDYSAIPDNLKKVFGRVTNGHNISYAKFSGNKDALFLDDFSKDDTFSRIKYIAFAAAETFSEIKYDGKIDFLGVGIPSMAQWKIIYDNIDAFSESKYDSKYKFGRSVLSSSLDGWGMLATLNMTTGEVAGEVGIGNRLFVVFPVSCGCWEDGL
ncbi:MAG: hypothetical protein IJ673_12980 [Treponema sp.]|nr:hypothetical protein [Treponema sp.]